MDSTFRLVGRDSALQLAEGVLDEAIGGAGQLLLVSGEPGIGKTALLAEIARRARRRGVRVLRGACRGDAGTPPYWPWTQVLRGAPEFTVPLQGGDHSAEDAADATFRFFDAVTVHLAALARTAPLLIELDDLHWADRPSIQLLEFVAGQLATDPVLLLGAVRDTEPVDWSGRLTRQVLPLAGLDVEDVASLIATVAGSRPTPDRAEAVRRRCGGNPFFVRELSRLVLSRGGWEQLGRAENTLPDGVRETLEQRLIKLSPPCRELLALAAVAGPEVWPEMLARAAGITPQAVGDLLDEAEAARVVVRDDAGRRFAHDLFRDALLAALPAAELAKAHLSLGLSLRDLAGSNPLSGGAAGLAAHFVAAVDAGAVALAIEHSVLAAREATDKLGHADAARHYSTALQLMDADDARRSELLLAQAAAEDRAGDTDAARSIYDVLVDQARRAGDATLLARSALAIHALGARAGGHGRRQAQLLREAADSLRGTDTTADRTSVLLRSRVLSALARSYRHSEWMIDELDPSAVQTAAEAVRLAERADDPGSLAQALLAAQDVAWEPGSAPSRLPIIASMQDAARRAGDADLEAEAQVLRAAALIELGDPRGPGELARYVGMAETLGHARGRWAALTRRATLAELEGRVEDALELSEAALQLGLRIGIPDAAGCYSTLRGSLAGLGAPPPTISALGPSDPLWPFFPLLEAWSEVNRGNPDGAAKLIAGFAVQTLPEKYDLEFLMVAAVVCAATGSHAQRDAVYARLAPRAGLHAVVGGCASYHGAVDHALGLLAAAEGEAGRAETHFKAAIASYDRSGTPAWAALSDRELDRLCHEQTPVNIFRLGGGSWQLRFDNIEVHLPDAKGLHDLATLLAAPDQEIHVMTLQGLPVTAGADPVLDERSRAAYARRLTELDEQIARADARGDESGSVQAHAEREALLRELSAATGLGGRSRRLGDETERARKTVTARIRDALRRIERVHPALAAHLRVTVSTGSTCIYRPRDSVRWNR